MKKTLLSIIFILSSFLHSQTTYNVPADFNSIQEAVNNSQDGDVILIANGEYFEAVYLSGKSIDIIGQSTEGTIINGSGIINDDVFSFGEADEGEPITNGATLSYLTIKSNNNPNNLGRSGILVSNYAENVLIENVIIENVSSSGSGAGIFMNYGASVTLQNCVIRDNSSNENGGGIYIENGSTVSIINTQIINNSAQDGGGIHIEGGSLANINNSEISNNIATGDGYQNGGGLFINSNSEINTIVNIENSLITNNICESGNSHGGGVSVINQGAQLTIFNTTIRGNESNTGGGVYALNTDLSLEYCEVSLNKTSNDGGGVTISGNGDEHNIINCTFYDNEASPENIDKNGVYITNPNSSNVLNILNSIVWENIYDIENEFINIEYSNTQQFVTGQGNISTNPLFVSVDPINPDYNLLCESPCIDAGNPQSEYNDPNGTINDMGCYPSEGCAVSGCTDITACNFNVEATEDDGSCEFIEQVTISGETETCEESILLEAISDPEYTYQWYLDGDIINNENQTTISATQSGNYKVEVENGGTENNYSLQFDGQNDYVEIQNVSINHGNTISFWAKSDQPQSWGNVISAGQLNTPNGEFAISFTNDYNDEFGLYLTIGNGVGYVPLTENTNWNHFVITLPNVPTMISDVIVYQNGISAPPMELVFSNAELNTEEVTEVNNELMVLGQNICSNNPFYFNGSLDQLSIWSTVLNQTQIESLYNCPPIGNEEGLLNYWAIEDQGSAILFDSKNITYNGDLINMNTNDSWDPEAPTQNCNTNCLSSAEINITINNCGCTDSSANNFNASANVDDGTCEYLGCTDSAADNFDSIANVDDGTCEYLGCTDSNADNFDSTANVDDGSCEYFGCTDSTADNFNATANVDDGSCEYLGCTDSDADNFDSTANVDDGTCEYLGCTDSNANNFDSTANVDDGSCEYLGCTDLGACNYNNIANVDDGSCEYDTCAGCTDPNADNYNPEATVDSGNCSYLGCTDSGADNFDATANEDDGTCEYLGCTDSSADNFDSSANSDDGSCEYLGCTDPSACNFDSTANTDDGSCQLCASREFNDGSYLDVDSEIINAQGITISFWVNDNDFCANPEDFATYIDFGSQDSYRYVIRNRSCKIEAFFEGDMLPTEFDWGTMDWGYPKASAAGGIGPQSGWRQITAVFCPTTIRVYVSNEDGTNLVASNGTGVYFSQGFNLFAEDVKRIGSNQVDYEPANAMIDEVRIWNRALSGEEISARAGLTTILNIDEELSLNGYWQMDCENPFLNEVTGQLGADNLSVVNENFNNNSCETDNNYDYTCPVDLTGVADCNSCDPPEGCTDEEACNYDYLAVVSIPDACFYITDYCPDLEYPEYYDCDCKCINDSDSDDVCDELEVDGCSEDETACNYNPEGTEPCIYAIDQFPSGLYDCDGICYNDNDPPLNNPDGLGDGICDEIDNCPNVYNPDQFDFNDDGIGDACDGVGLEEGGVAKEIIKVTDVLGRETQKETKGSTLMYWYNTGEVEIIYNFK